MRYRMGSRMIMLGLAISILALKVQAPSSSFPLFILANRSRFSWMLRLRYGLSFPGSVGVPFRAAISSAVLWST
ncbi:hypothetical protein D3C73_1578050 [compost metagenome]